MSKEVAQSQEAKTFIQTLVVQPAKVQGADVQAYKNAVNQAKWGFCSKWFDLVDNLLSDPFLQDQIDKLVGIVTNSELQFQIDGKAVDVINDLIETTEFEELLTEIVHSKVFGKSVVNTSFAPKFDVFTFPRKHIYIKNIGRALSDREKVITTMPGGMTGYDYTQDEFILEFGKDSDLGIMFRVAQYVIYKRGNFGDWAQYAEIFGMPFVLGKYNSTDTNARDQLFTSLAEIGGKPVAAVPKETDVEIVWNSGTGSTDLYKSLKDACNEEIMIGVLGETMTTISGSSRSQSETHSDTLDEKGKTLCRYVQRQLNSKFLPLLIKRGYPVTNGKFVFPAAKEDLTVDNLSTLSKLIKIPSKWIHDKYAIPLPEGNEDVAGGQNTAPQPPEGGADPIPAPDVPLKKGDERSGGVLNKKSVKLSDIDTPPSGGWGAFFEGLSNFFVNARTSGSRAINSVLNLADKSTNYTAGISIDKLFNQALNDIYKQYGINPDDMPLISKPLYDITNTSLQHAIDTEFSVGAGRDLTADFILKNQPFIEEFKTNASVFSAFKNHQQTNDIVALLTDENGNIRSFDEFRKLANNVSRDYNQTWLKTEYNQAVRAARMAAKVKSFAETADLYPNMEYMESTAANKREEHASWVGTILPITDPWWDTHMPPSAWGCECSVRNTDADIVEPPGDDTLTINPLFANNPAKTAEILNMDEHPYVKNCEDKLKKEIIIIAKEWEKYKQEILVSYRNGGNGGKIISSGLVDTTTSDYQRVYQCADEFAKMKMQAEILPKVNIKSPLYKEIFGDLIGTKYENKCPDLKVNGLFYEHEGFITGNPKNAVENMLSRGLKQSGRVIIDDCGVSNRYLLNNILARVKQGQNIEEVWILKDGRITLFYKKTEAR